LQITCPRDTVEQELDASTLDAVALHHKPDQGVFNQLG
jgi:hypothetical protein